jgi:hypothetical protein
MIILIISVRIVVVKIVNGICIFTIRIIGCIDNW